MTDDIHCDLLVAGAGMAGMAAGARAACSGLDTVVAGSSSFLGFSSGILDYIGVYPADSRTHLSDPCRGLDRLREDFPKHAYALTGHDKILESFAFVSRLLKGAGLPYTCRPGRNTAVLTAMGTFRPGYMVPATVAPGTRAVPGSFEGKTLLVAGIRGLTGFSAAQVAQGALSEYDRTVAVEVVLPGVKNNVPPQILASRMEDPGIQSEFIRQVSDRANQRGVDADVCGIPAVCGINNSHKILTDMEKKVGLPMFEIPGGPPSVPGLRLKHAFERILAERGARLLSNVRLKDPVFDGKRFTVTADFSPHPRKIRARGIVLATGRFFGSGLHARRERIVETLFHLDVTQPLGRRHWHDNRFLTPRGHRINRAGIETDSRFRPLDERRRPVYAHLYAAGSILAHNDWPRLKSGSGTALVSACAAVDAFAASGEAGRDD